MCLICTKYFVILQTETGGRCCVGAALAARVLASGRVRALPLIDEIELYIIEQKYK